MINSLGYVSGIPVFVDRTIKYKTVKRLWKERMFSFPWRPFQRFKQVPDGYFMKDGKVIHVDDKIICNPLTAANLERLIKESNK